MGRACVCTSKSRMQPSSHVAGEQPLPFSETQLHHPRELDAKVLPASNMSFLYCRMWTHGESPFQALPQMDIECPFCTAVLMGKKTTSAPSCMPACRSRNVKAGIPQPTRGRCSLADGWGSTVLSILIIMLTITIIWVSASPGKYFASREKLFSDFTTFITSSICRVELFGPILFQSIHTFTQ